MSATWRTSARRLLVVGLMFSAVAIATGRPTYAGSDFVKYYLVAASYQGAPENLPEIAERFLGTSARGGEILDLNSARRQADGGRVVAGGALHAGWSLVLPWDAVGAEVRYGELPNGPASPAGQPPHTAPASPSPAGQSATAPGGPPEPDADRVPE